MAYMSQQMKSKLAPQIKAVLKKYGMKGTISVGHHTSLTVKISSGKLDMIGNYVATGSCHDANYVTKNKMIDVNTYWCQDHFSGQCRDFLLELIAAMNAGNWDKSDIQTDYFNVGWYTHVYIGSWERPYEHTA